jgi:ribonuclease E
VPEELAMSETPTDNTPGTEPRPPQAGGDTPSGPADAPEAPAAKKAAKKAPAKKAAKKAPAKKAAKKTAAKAAAKAADPAPAKKAAAKKAAKKTEDDQAGSGAPMVLFQPPETPVKAAKKAPAKKAAAKKSTKKTAAAEGAGEAAPADVTDQPDKADEAGRAGDHDEGGDGGEGGARRRPRRRGGRRRRKGGGDADTDADETSEAEAGGGDAGDEGGAESGSRRRRTRNRAPKSPEDEIASVSGSTRLEAKKQRRREGREAGRRRAPIVSEAEFLARRESVDRVMVIRQRDDLTQIAVLEDKVLVEHYVSRESQTSLIGNVYLGRVQNVLPSMEAAFVDIGKGRNAVLYAGEVNWAGLGHQEGQPRKIESVLSPGQAVLVQVTKDPIGHKGARLTGQVSLPGRFLVLVPDGTTSGISRKLPDTERNRLKTLLKEIVPDTAGVIVRTAAEGASEEELTRDVERLTARWEDIEAKVRAGKAPQLLYGEPDLTLKVVRDLFTEDFSRLIVQGQDAWDLVDGYVSHVAPDLRERLERFDDAEGDLFAAYRVDEQIAKGLDRKVWLPSGGSLVIDRTEAMTVVDVNTGKFTGSGGNLEETVTKNNLEAAEEIVRQLRLRDIGGIIVVDFIDMVLESNRELVLRRLVECLGRDRTRHQVAEVTSLGLVQMTRKRIGTGLLEAFSEECSTCKGRGLILHDHPVETAGSSATDDEPRSRRGRGRGRGKASGEPAAKPVPSPKDLAATKPHPPTDATDPEPTALEDAPEVEPSAVEEVAPASVEEAREDAAPTPPEPAEEPAEEPAASTEEPATPTVVTSTRRRRTASRPAGPPAGVESPAESAADSPEDPAGEPGDRVEVDDEHAVAHVPIKKKGSRKR